MNDFMIDWFKSRSRIFHSFGDVFITDEGLQNSGLSSALRAFEQEGIFIASAFPVKSEGPPHLVASYATQGGWLGGGFLYITRNRWTLCWKVQYSPCSRQEKFLII
jgi:hypothetical protein